MRIQHNITAMNAYRNYNNNTSAIGKNLEKLSSGYKINRAGDDAAGLAVSQKMRLQIAGLAQAQKNAKSGVSYIQTAEGALSEVHEMLERMYTLAEQSANGTFADDTDRTQLQKEVNNLMEEINRIGKTANFNGMGIFKQYVKPGAADPTGGANPATPAAISDTGKVPDVKFTAATDGASEQPAVKASFKIDLAGAKLTAGDGTDELKLTVGGVELTGAQAGGTTEITGADIASKFDTKTVTINSNEYKVSVSGTELTFTMTSEPTAAVDVSSITASGLKAGSTAASSAPTANYEVTDKTNGKAAVSAGTGTKGKVEVDFNGLTGADVIGDTVKIGDKTYEFVKTGGDVKTAGNVKVEVGEGDAAAALATKFTTAANASKDDKLANGTSSGTKVTFEAQTAGTANMIAEANAVATDAGGETPAPTTTPTKYESTLTGDDGTNALAAGDTIAIGGKTYTLDASDNTGDKISVGANDTFEKQMKAAIEKYNADTTQDFTAAYEKGKVTFTLKEGKTATAAPTFTITDAANKISAATPTAVQEDNGGAGTITFWIGAEAGDDNKLTIDLMSLDVGDISIADPAYNNVGVDLSDKVSKGDISLVDITTADKAMDQLSVIKAASDSVSNMRGTLGAMQNRLDHTLKNLSVMQENMQDAESVIRDTDVAEEMMAYTKNNILVQSAQAMLAQANQIPQGVLQLLG